MIYVDHAAIRYGRMKMSHLSADTQEELRDIADKLGLRRWIQHPDTWKEHLDVSESKRREAIALGALEITSRELVRLAIRKREALGNEQPTNQ